MAAPPVTTEPGPPTLSLSFANRNGDVHLNMGRTAPGDRSDTSSEDDEPRQNPVSLRYVQTMSQWSDIDNFLINRARAADLDAYTIYLESFMDEDPRLRVVDDYLSKKPLHNHCPQCSFLDCTLINVDSGGSSSVAFRSTIDLRMLFVKQVFKAETEALGKAIRLPSARKILICEDLQPAGAKFLGGFLSLELSILEYYINRQASFESKTPSAHVFDYPETYYSERTPRSTEESEFLSLQDHARPCPLVRIWKDVYGLFQRVVWVVVFCKELNTHIHLVLVDSLRLPKDSTANLISSGLPTFQEFKARRTYPDGGFEQNSFRERLEDSILATTIASPTAVMPDSIESEIKATPEIHHAILKILCTQWRLLIRRAQETISESSAPLTGDVDDIVEVLQRKHDFEKLSRCLSALIASATLIPKALPSHNPLSFPALAELKSFEASLQSWALQLEKVSQSLLGLLAVSESKKATAQAVRSKNLQLLAFVFIPISTVSSIYGMNTIEILSTPPRNWSFVVGAIIAIVASALAVALYDSTFVTGLIHRVGQSMHCLRPMRASKKPPRKVVTDGGGAKVLSRKARKEAKAERKRAQRARKAKCVVM